MSRKSIAADDANPLLSMESMLAIKQRAEIIFDKWEQGTGLLRYVALLVIVIFHLSFFPLFYRPETFT